MIYLHKLFGELELVLVDSAAKKLVSLLDGGIIDLSARHIEVTAALQLFKNKLNVDSAL